VAADGIVAPRSARDPYHRRVIPVATIRSRLPSGTVRLEPLGELSQVRPIDAAEALRDLPGLALLESARPARNARWTFLTADPVAILTEPAAGSDPFAVARRLLARLDAGAPDREGTTAASGGAGAFAVDAVPPFLGGLVGYLGY
jgi:hypothetical protein